MATEKITKKSDDDAQRSQYIMSYLDSEGLDIIDSLGIFDNFKSMGFEVDKFKYHINSDNNLVFEFIGCTIILNGIQMDLIKSEITKKKIKVNV